jgi:hypothetical protein
MSTASSRSLPFLRDGLRVVRNFLPPEVFSQICDECRPLRPGMKREKNTLAYGRVGCFVDSRSQTRALLTSPAVAEKVARIVGQPMEPSPYPVELRCYRVGAEMVWHKDDVLYDIPQVELVICLNNDSDAQTEWINPHGEHAREWTPPNTALFVRAGETGAAHRVTPVKRGERTILKMVWAVPGSTPLPAFFEHLDALPGLRERVRRGLGMAPPPHKRRR